MKPGPVFLNGVPLSRDLFSKWLDEPYGTGLNAAVVVDVHRPDAAGFGDAAAAADAWHEMIEEAAAPDDDDALVAEVLRVADANTVDGAVDVAQLEACGELGKHVTRELGGAGPVSADYVERCALTWRAKRDAPLGPWWREHTAVSEPSPPKVTEDSASEEEQFSDEDEGATLGATNALSARLRAVEDRRARDADAEARRLSEDVAALRRARRAADRRAAEAEAARLTAEAEAARAAEARKPTLDADALQRRVEELERQLAARDAVVQEAPAPQRPRSRAIESAQAASRGAFTALQKRDRPRRAPPPPQTSNKAATALQRVTRGNLTRRWTLAVATLEAEVRAAQERLETEVREAQRRLAAAREALPRTMRPAHAEAPAPAPLPSDPFAGNAETFVRAAHAFVGDGDQELTLEQDQALLVRTAHLADASGWVFAVAVDDGEGEPRCGYVPISHLGGAVSPRFFEDGASEVS